MVMRIEEAESGNAITCASCSHSFSPRSESAAAGRVTLTRAQLKIPEVEEFVVLLVNIASDGVLEYEELQKLTDWLNNYVHLEVPAVKFMVDLMVRVCADGKITDEEIFEIQLGIERVLPKEYRTQITDARKAAYYDQPASANQLDTIESITHERPVGLSRREASEMLDRLFTDPPAVMNTPNYPCERTYQGSSTNAGIASRWKIEYHWPAVIDPGRPVSRVSVCGRSCFWPIRWVPTVCVALDSVSVSA